MQAGSSQRNRPATRGNFPLEAESKKSALADPIGLTETIQATWGEVGRRGAGAPMGALWVASASRRRVAPTRLVREREVVAA